MSGKLNTKDIKTGGKVAKTFHPGNHAAKITAVKLEEFTYKPGGYHMVMHLEGPDKGADFEGFFLDKDKPELGRHKGQVGRVKASEWAFADGETKKGIPVSRDADILKFLKTLCMAIGKVKWLEDQNDKHETIESLVKAFNDEKPFEGIFLNWCIGGKEYEKGGYTNYDMFLPKPSREGYPFEAQGLAKTKLLEYNEDTHIKKKKTQNVTDFGETPSMDTDVDSDFQL